MPRLSLGFDMEQFLNHCRMTKPPYECPHALCGRVYRSFIGIQNHMNAFDHENTIANKCTLKNNNYGLPESELLPIPMCTDLKSVEFELDGKMCNITVYDRIEIVSKEFYESSLAPPVEEQLPELVKTVNNKPINKCFTPKMSKKGTKEKDRGVDVQRYTIDEKKSQKLPEAAFKIIPGYYENLPDAPKRTDAYYKFVEKSTEELDEEIEYDMDEEDIAWLDIINSKREKESLEPVSMESFELLMDRLEKESFFQAQSTGREPGAPIDEDAVCCICMDGECQNSNVILFCDMCNLAVHQECYGVPYIPEGQWLCRRCLQSPSKAVDCALCPNKGGAFKQTDDGRWAHVVCAMWIPEVCFANTVFLEPIDSINNIPPARWKLSCYICVQRGVGACIQCNKINCYTAFHVTCAQQAGLHMKIDAIRETSANGTSVTVRKAAYCDMHTPADSDARPQVEELLDSVKKAQAKAASRQKMKKARKILAEKRSAAPIVSVPTLPANRIQHLAGLVKIDKKSLFIHRLMAYWTLKRRSRNGVPLLRRLTSSYSRRNNSERGSPTKKSPEMNKKKQIRKASENLAQSQSPEELMKGDKFRDEIKYWQRLRQDLERARLLCELIRKREKTKRELIKAQAEERMTQLAPFVALLQQKIDQLEEKDVQQIFAEPVDFEEVPDYLDVVKHPIDLCTMRQKAQAHQYQSVDQFVADFHLLINNCLSYNSRDTVFYRAGVKLRDQGGAIIRQLKRDVETIGFCPVTGLLLSHRPKPPPEITDETVIQEVEDVVNCDLEEGETYEMRKDKLLLLLDKANMIKHPVTRLKRVKLIRREIGNVRRKQSLLESGGKKHKKDSDDSEDSDENSSLADEEGEPGCPSPPSTPIPKSPPQKMLFSPSEASPLFPKRRPSAEQKTPKTTKVVQNNPIKSDLKQSRIDSFFVRNEASSSKKEKLSTPALISPKDFSTEKKTQSKVGSFTQKKLTFTADPMHDSKSQFNFNSQNQSKYEATSLLSPAKDLELPLDNELNLEKLATEVSTAQADDKAKESRKSENCPSTKRKPGRPPKSLSAIGIVAKHKTQESENEDGTSAENKSSRLFESNLCIFKKSSTKDLILPDINKEGLSNVEIPQASSLSKESFKIYRQGGEFSQSTDDETQSSSNSSLLDSSEESECSSNSSDGASDSENSSGEGESLSSAGHYIPLEPLDLVWAKCRGYPWYPALIINPKMPRTGYFHNHVPIPVPPDEVLAHATVDGSPIYRYLVLFFDQKRTWQWLPRNKLEPLGVNSAMDKTKLVESRKPSDRKAVKKAYEKAILHRCRVTGENTGFSGEESDNDQNTKQE